MRNGFSPKLLTRLRAQRKQHPVREESVGSFSAVILVEGLFDLAVQWQAGFRNTTCAIGMQLTPAQLSQLAEQPRHSVYIAFDQDDNQAGQKGSHQLAQRLQGSCEWPTAGRVSPWQEPHRPHG